MNQKEAERRKSQEKEVDKRHMLQLEGIHNTLNTGKMFHMCGSFFFCFFFFLAYCVAVCESETDIRSNQQHCWDELKKTKHKF